jgi:hypothetical protein
MRVLATVAGLLLMVVVAAGTIWWFFIASFGERQLSAFLDRSTEQGWRITIAEQERSGFPFAVRLRLRGVSVVHQAREGLLEADIPEILVEADALRPRNMLYTLEQAHAWRWTPAGEDGVRSYQVGRAGGVLAPREEASGWLATATLSQVAWDTGTGQAGRGSADSIALDVRLPLDFQSADFAAEAVGVVLPTDTVFGRQIDNAILDGVIAPLPRDAAPAALIAWQRAGGQLTVTRSKIEFGALQASVYGDLAFDGDMRPFGAMRLRMIDPQAILTIATTEGWVKHEQLGYAQIGMGLFSRPNAQGENELSTRLDMRNGGLWIGPIRLVSLPRVVPEQQ